MKQKLCYLILILVTGSVNAGAKDLGKLGHTFEIKEEPFTEMMKRKLETVDIEQEKKKMQNIAKDRVNNPIPVKGVKRALEGRIFYFDPTYTLKEDAVLPCGKILYKAGTSVNPLEHMELNRRLFFIDGRDKVQTDWLIEQLEQPLDSQENIKDTANSAKKALIEDRVILVGGSVLQLKENIKEEHKDKIYFDQSGELVGRLGIQYVPAIGLQDGLKVRIEEIKL